MKWAPVIPLIGGFPLGSYYATKEKPMAIYSYSAFEANDSHLTNYWDDVPYRRFDVEGEVDTLSEGLDFVVATPPCAALSQLNTGKTEEAKGVCAASTVWMYESIRDAVKFLNPKVIMGENAPALYTKKGLPVAEQLQDLATELGYSFTLYKTNTRFHGIPQSRERTFYILWKTDTAPVMNFYERNRDTFQQYLSELAEDAMQNDIVINKKLTDEPQWRFLKARYKTDDPRPIIAQRAITAHNYIMKSDLLPEYIEWITDNGTENEIRLAHHMKMKYDSGRGIWDSSVHVFSDVMNAVIGRNLNDTIHPHKDRSLTVREALHMMGFPEDFELVGGRSKLNHIAQNVPTCTARDMTFEVMKYLDDDLDDSGLPFMRQNNVKKTYDTPFTTGATLESFI